MERKKLSKPLSFLLDVVKIFAGALAIALVINNFIIVNASIPTGSMESTVMAGDRVLFNRLAYISSDPQRYDIVIFHFPYSDEKEDYVKRIIGLPGETVEMIDGKVYIDGNLSPLLDSFINEEPEGSFGPYQVPEGQYFLLGDNRNNSLDSRYWPSPFIERSDIMGKAVFSYYPEIHMLSELAQ